MNNTVTLDRLPEGHSARICSMGVQGAMRRRMQDTGFLDGVMITCLFRGRKGEPAAFLISGAVIALRREEMQCITVEPIGKGQTENVGCSTWV